jgi:hypothetical protein
MRHSAQAGLEGTIESLPHPACFTVYYCRIADRYRVRRRVSDKWTEAVPGGQEPAFA